MELDDAPVTVVVARAAKELHRRFDEAMTAAGGSSSTWLVLSALTSADRRTQADLADAVGVRQPTISHHLDALERAGFVTRERPPGNRRAQEVRITDAGERLFLRLRRAAGAFDGRLRAGLSGAQVDDLRRLLGVLVENSRPD
jgi:MarR family transcriptional regulator, transcriptional regulator for hemolysin